MNLRESLRNRVNRMAESTGIFKKDVFELDGVPAFREYYMLYMFVWQAIYRGFYKDWHTVPMRTIRSPKGKTRQMSTLNAGKTACSQMARYTWNERCALTVSQKGRDDNDETPDPLNEWLQDLLKDNNFGVAFGDALEKSYAMGGGAIREWVEIPKAPDGTDIGEGKIRIGYTMATQFVPTAWDNSGVKAGIFISREAKDGYYYTTVEWHRLDGHTYRGTNDVYRMPIKETKEPQCLLGWWYPLDKIYPLLSPDTTIENVDNAFFQYFRPFGANYADDNSPLGMSIYASALDTLHGLDIIFDSYQREFILGKKRIIAPARAMKMVPGLNGGNPDRYFDADDEVWEALATDTNEDLKIVDNSVNIRVQEHITGINGDLAILCTQIGFDPGTLSFDASRGLKTATEVISENSKTYGTVRAHENIIKDSLEKMIHAVIELAVHYNLTWKGQKIADMISQGYSVSVKFDDSIIQDKDAEISQGTMLVGAGLMSKKKFMTDKLGYTPEEADKELAQIQEEGKNDTRTVADLYGGMT